MKSEKKYASDDYYKKLSYRIEKQITVEDNENIIEYSKKDLYLYILYNEKHKIRFAFISTNYYYPNTQIDGNSLEFHKWNLKDNLTFDITTDILGNRNIEVGKKKSIMMNPSTCFYQMKKSNKGEDKFELRNTNKISTKRIATENKFWFFDYINHVISESVTQNPKKSKKKQSKNNEILKKKIKNKLFYSVEPDDRIRKIIMCELIKSKKRDLMIFNSHTIILTQGGTGKSSMCGAIGYNLDNTSNAGVYGYYSTHNSKWNAGVVEQTDKAIIVDEINELVSENKSDSILSTINKPLENGVYTYGKAGGKEVNIANMFIFMGNISDDFTFETFISNIASNIETIGRRFAYILYDEKCKFKKLKANKNNFTEDKLITAYSELTSFFYEYFMTKFNFADKHFDTPPMKIIENFAKAKINNILQNIESPATRKFIKSYNGESYKRLKSMALKLTIHEHIDKLISYKYLIQMQYNKTKSEYFKNNIFSNSHFINTFQNIFKELTEDIIFAVENIEKHLNSLPQEKNHNATIIKTIERESKQTRLCLYAVCENLELSDNRKRIYYDKITNKGDLKYLPHNIKRQKTTMKKINQELSKYGVAFERDTQEKKYYFQIIREATIKKYAEVIIENDKNNTSMEISINTDNNRKV